MPTRERIEEIQASALADDIPITDGMLGWSEADLYKSLGILKNVAGSLLY